MKTTRCLSLILLLLCLTVSGATADTPTVESKQVDTEVSLAAVVADLSTQIKELTIQINELRQEITKLRGSTTTLTGPEEKQASTTTSSQEYITVGSTPETVKAVLGKPDTIYHSNPPYGEDWYYGTSILTFNNGRVASYYAGSVNLKVHDTPTTSIQTTTTTPPAVAENGSYYGQISDTTGKPKTTHVNGYYRKDGTYVRGHYRSK